ncbi:15-hydroxyprostaglandin dehydrogenase [Trichonephila clavipes]|nr:15-hydroxyprostaglandin dehydrogenase [Trichonephila clavipes]
MASAVLADPTRALQGTNRASRPAMEESENDVGRLEQLLLYADEPYLAGKSPLGDHLGKVIASPRPLHQLCRHCDVEQCGDNCTAHQGASTPVHGYHLSPKQTGIHH